MWGGTPSSGEEGVHGRSWAVQDGNVGTMPIRRRLSSCLPFWERELWEPLWVLDTVKNSYAFFCVEPTSNKSSVGLEHCAVCVVFPYCVDFSHLVLRTKVFFFHEIVWAPLKLNFIC